jgi:2'-5' RNA ligase
LQWEVNQLLILLKTPVMFKHSAYIVLDLPSPMRETVAQLRLQADKAFPPLPVEITVAGSSGVGTIEADESQERVFGLLADVAAKTKPLNAAFHSIERFPNSPVVYLSLVDNAPFIALHKAILSTPIRFRASPFPFGPHCTIRPPSAGTLDDAEFRRIAALSVPQSPFLLESMSVYELDSGNRECRLLYRAILAGR